MLPLRISSPNAQIQQVIIERKVLRPEDRIAVGLEIGLDLMPDALKVERTIILKGKPETNAQLFKKIK